MFKRSQLGILEKRLLSSYRRIQIILGPRQVGKSTLSYQLAKTFPYKIHTASGDEAANATKTWIQQQWVVARHLAK